MLKHSFIFGGIDMRERFGLIVERFADVLIPAARPRKIEIPERDGMYDFGAKYYDEREITVHCAAVSLNREACRELAAALSRKAQLIRWDEPDKYYLGRVYDPADIERIVGQANRFQLTFICDPFAYGRTVSEPIPEVFQYAGTATTPTRIQITNTGTEPIRGIRMKIRERSS